VGLDISHDAFHGSYGAFNRFRQAVARAIGGSYPPHDPAAKWPLDPDQWYWWAGEEDQNPRGFGDRTHPGLYEFFMHSDCDGEIGPRVCMFLADELEAILPEIAAQGDGGGHLAAAGGLGAVTEQFIRGCRAAGADMVPLEFG